jgi:rhamnulokinase
MIASPTSYVAVDLGATSGRVVVGVLDRGSFALHEVHRFPNESRGSGRSRTWDVEELFAQTRLGLARAAARDERGGAATGGPVRSVGVTAWGVDAGVLDPEGVLRAPVRHYRSADPHGPDDLLRRWGAVALYARTGVLPQPINTAFRLREIVADAEGDRGSVPDGSTVLLVPDLWGALLTGERAAERSIASTTGLLSLRTGSWDDDLVRDVGVEPALLPPVVDNGQVAGEVGAACTYRGGPGQGWAFVRVASHDTASAVASLGGGPRAGFLSSGTWSLVGVERAAPVVTPAALAAGFTNEAGWGGTTLFMRNLTGLWLLEQAVRQWRAQGLGVDLPALVAQAEAVGPLAAAVDVTTPELVHADDVLDALERLCGQAGQALPRTPAEVTRCILQSLALTYRRTLALCEQLTGEVVETLDMVGGGTRNALLRRLTAQACGRPVRVGPVEGTSLGSVAAQALAVGDLIDHEQAGAVLRRSVTPTLVPPDADPGARTWWRDLDAAVPTPWSPA